MQGAPNRQVNAEEMLAELKRALESSTRAPNALPPSASTAPKSSSQDRESRRSQIDRGSDRPAEANARKSIGPRTDPQKSTRSRSRSWKLIAGGLALAGAAAICVSFAFMNTAPDLPERERSVAATESMVRPQNEQALKPSSDSRSAVEGSQQGAPLQAGALETGPNAGTAPAISGSIPAGGKAELDAPHLASFGLESAAPAFRPSPPNLAAALVATHRIGPDGAPIATAPSTPASPDSAPPLAETPKPAAAPAASQAIRPDGPAIGSAPPTSASTSSAPLAETPKPAAAPVTSQTVKSDGAPIATAPPSPASTDSAPLAETPKPNATRTASVSNESAELSTPKAGSKKKPLVKTARQKLLGSPKPPVKPIAQAERQSTAPAPPKEAEKSPPPAQGAGNPTAAAPVAAAPVKTTSVQQRVADGVTHAFGYLVHLPGALVPHLGGPNPDDAH
jgi:hypothetical protein